MKSKLAMYCSTCHALRGIHDWHERRDSLAIELEPCGHITVRIARLEWMAPSKAA